MAMIPAPAVATNVRRDIIIASASSNAGSARHGEGRDGLLYAEGMLQ
jgi:hypothetical protein